MALGAKWGSPNPADAGVADDPGTAADSIPGSSNDPNARVLIPCTIFPKKFLRFIEAAYSATGCIILLFTYCLVIVSSKFNTRELSTV